MSDRTEHRLSDDELESALRDVGAHLAYPATADLTGAVRARIERRVSASLWDALWSPRLALAPAVATVVLLALATLAFQPIGSQAAEALGLRGLVIFRGAQTPPPTVRPLPSLSASGAPRPSPNGSGVLPDAHRVASLDAASREVGFAVLVPAALGTPDEVHVRVTGQEAQAFLVYAPRPGVPASAQTGIGVLVTEVRGSFDFALLGKVLGPGTTAEQLTVNGSAAVWIEGLHQFFYRAANGQFVNDTIRLSGNVLIWNSGDILLRVEGDLPRDRVVQIAASIP